MELLLRHIGKDETKGFPIGRYTQKRELKLRQFLSWYQDNEIEDKDKKWFINVSDVNAIRIFHYLLQVIYKVKFDNEYNKRAICITMTLLL